jgi:hypothetical protein
MHGINAEFIFSADGINILSLQKITVPGLNSVLKPIPGFFLVWFLEPFKPFKPVTHDQNVTQ